MDKMSLLYLNESIKNRLKFLRKVAAESEVNLRQKSVVSKLALQGGYKADKAQLDYQMVFSTQK